MSSLSFRGHRIGDPLWAPGRGPACAATATALEQASTQLDDGRVLVAGGRQIVAPGHDQGVANAWLHVPG
ncbi:hypothetical protein [Sorangium sp. So ce1389]|uniref:hypothetical protein n=1 Tax=Sorangium sp. So ce1389 TaxID=3133336 RepID=UPI003F5EF54D